MKSPEEIQTRIAWLEGQRGVMRTYLDMKVDTEDAHGTADAAMDIRDIDSELLGLRWVLGS